MQLIRLYILIAEESIDIEKIRLAVEAAEFVAEEIYKALPDIKNRPEIFGEQRIMDAEDNIVGYEEKLLISPAAISLEKLFEKDFPVIIITRNMSIIISR